MPSAVGVGFVDVGSGQPGTDRYESTHATHLLGSQAIGMQLIVLYAGSATSHPHQLQSLYRTHDIYTSNARFRQYPRLLARCDFVAASVYGTVM